MSRLSVHTHVWYVGRMPRCHVRRSLLQVERELVLVGHMSQARRRIGRAHNRRREWLALEETFCVSHAHHRVGLLIVLKLSPGRYRVICGPHTNVLVPIATLRRLDGLDT